MLVSVTQVTSGPKHHFFGYIGHALTVPWNAGGRYIVALETEFFERMPEPGEAAQIVLVDTQNGNRLIPVERTLAWNLQQGTMLYWNPASPETQFFFNDLDPRTGVVFTALYDVEERRRVREYRFGEQSIANGGVNPRGRWFAGINYGRASRARKVISYAGAFDWTLGGKTANPEDDGLFRVDIATGERKLLVSYWALAEFLKLENAETYPLYVHHTLWNRDGDRVFFIVRGSGKGFHPNAACVIHADGTGLKRAPFTGHPEWGLGKSLVVPGKSGFDLHDVDQERVVGSIGSAEVFPNNVDDSVLSPDGALYVGSHSPTNDSCVYTILRLADGVFVRSPRIRTQRRPKDSDVRIDPAPCWNRTSDAILVPGIAADGTRQMFELLLSRDPK